MDEYDPVKPPPEVQNMNLGDPPPYNYREPWWKKHNDTSANCCMECVCRSVCLPYCLGTCVYGVVTTAFCGCCSTNDNYQCCWYPFQCYDKYIAHISDCVMASVKLPQRRNQGEVQSLKWFQDCMQGCWTSFKECLECVVCCPCNCMNWFWESRCVKGIRDCCSNVGFYTGRCICGFKDCVYYTGECCCVRCGCCNEPKLDH